MEQISILDLVERIPDEKAAYAYMERLRWPDKPVCPHCGSINDHRFLTPENGTSRRTRTGSYSQRRVWKCRDCKRQFSVITNTPFHGSKVPLRIWIFILFEMCANKNGIAAREIARKYKLTNKTAWYVTHRVRVAMDAMRPVPMTGVVVADETFIGGDPENLHADERERRRKHHTTKTPVLALIEEHSGEVRAKVVANVQGRTLRAVMDENVDRHNAILHTDSGIQCVALGRGFVQHHSVNHNAGQYVDRRTGASTNRAENYFSQLKRSIDGTHHHVSREHLDRYLAEFNFRYSTCKMDDSQRMARLMGQTAGKRVTYRRVTGD